MTNCQFVQERLTECTTSTEQPSLPLITWREIENHTDTCSECCRHALSLLGIMSSLTKDLQPPTIACESSLFAQLDSQEKRTWRPWLKSAAAVLAITMAFWAGRIGSKPIPPEISTDIVSRAAPMPATPPPLDLAEYEYNGGFFAGRTLVVHQDN